MNRCLIDLFESEDRLNRLVTVLPNAFKTVRQEMPKGNPSVDILLEYVITGFFINEFGEDDVLVPDKGIERRYDLEICGEKMSVKTGTNRTQVKVLWTVDPLQIEREVAEYKPFCDIFLVEIFWDQSAESIFYIPLSVQEDAKKQMDESNYLSYLTAGVGTNHRGISITGEAMKILRNHKDTKRATVDWTESGITAEPYDRWIDFWENRR